MNLLLLTVISTQASAGWDTAPFVSPIVQGAFYTAGDDFYPSVKLGVGGGLAYKNKEGFPLLGHTRVYYNQNLGSQMRMSGWGLGSFIGPRFGPISLEIGGDYLVDSYTVPGLYDGRFSSLSVPARVILDVWLARVEVAGGPIFIVDSIEGQTRQGLAADQNLLGMGDEYFFMANARVGVGPLAVGAGFKRRVTAYGEDNSFGVQLLFLSLGSNPQF
ncbi:MAG: hypothetical protein VX278_03270 [Myxococcota bacterium]|nr:hypothetical protein [Myxococcota bacterium]